MNTPYYVPKWLRDKRPRTGQKSDMAKVTELRISVHHEGQTLVVVLDGDGVDSAQQHFPRRITAEGVAALVVQLGPMLRVALGRCLRKAFEASRARTTSTPSE